MTKEQILARIESRLEMVNEHQWYTPLAFLEDMRSLVHHNKDEEAY
jgi:hypothetical protein